MNKKGFTILEILAVIVIVLMLSLLLIPIIEKHIENTKRILIESQIATIENAAYVYAYNFRSEIPDLENSGVAIITLQTLINKGLLEEGKFIINDEVIIPLTSTVIIINYEGEIKTKYDKNSQTKPLIILKGIEKMAISKGSTYIEPGALLIKFNPKSIEQLPISYIFSNVNSAIPDKYEVQYTYTGADSITREVNVNDIGTTIDVIKPTITLNGSLSLTISKGSVYNDAGATANDNKDGDITSRITVRNEVNTKQKGKYYVKYDVVDFAGNSAITAIRTVIVN